VKTHLQELIAQAMLDMQRQECLPRDLEVEIMIERTRSVDHGDFSSNIAMILAKPARRNPREIAQDIMDRLLPSKHVDKVEIAGPGFINFHLTQASLQSVVTQILERGHEYGRNQDAAGHQLCVEFVSANPTGPLHVGHGRGAAYGATLSNILEAVGYEVHREYYVNDHGRQMDILATSVWLRYLELGGTAVRFPDNGYKGEYIYDIARKVRSAEGDELRFTTAEVCDGLPPDFSEGGDKEKHIDALIERAQDLLGETRYMRCFNAALESIVDDIRGDLEEFNVHFDRWFSERGLAEGGFIDHAIERLREAGHIYEKGGALWLAATELGDEKDRVVVRENGKHTYFASDIAYFLSKLERGFETAIYVLGADHHGYVARLRAAALGLDENPSTLEIPLVQFAILYRGGKKAQMSTRSGEFVTLRQLRQEVGTDAARFFYIMRSHEQHLDFDLDLAKSQSNDNPVYYIQYAHARICSMFSKVDDLGMTYNDAIGEAALDRLSEPQERAVLRSLAQYPEAIASAARKRAPHIVAHYLRDLAQEFHSYYNAHHVLVEDENLRDARLNLSKAVQQILANGLGLLGVSAPEKM
jgi:arginyl-tRNA synthetase